MLALKVVGIFLLVAAVGYAFILLLTDS